MVGIRVEPLHLLGALPAAAPRSRNHNHQFHQDRPSTKSNADLAQILAYGLNCQPDRPFSNGRPRTRPGRLGVNPSVIGISLVSNRRARWAARSVGDAI